MAEAEIERMVVRLMGDISQYEKAMKSATKITSDAAKKIGTKISEIGRSISGLGRSLSLRLTAPLTAMGTASLAAFGQFDQAMTESLSIMKVTTEQADRMRRLASDLAFEGKGPQGGTELARSYFYLASAGKDAEQSMALLPKVMGFATAGAFDMSKATDLLTDAQSALGMTMKDAQQDAANMVRLSDALVKANTLANASVEQFSIALTSKAGSAFKAYNIKLEEGMALLAAYADQGIKAELAGNAADRMIRLLTQSVAQNAKEFKKLNIQVFEAGEFRRFSDIMRDMEKALSGMTTEQKAAALTALGFEARMQSVILPLLGTSDALARYSKELQDATGFTEDVANKQMKSFSNQMKVLWNRIKSIGTSIGEILAPYVLKFSDALASVIRFWRQSSPEFKKTIVFIGLFLALLGPAIVFVGKIVTAFGMFITVVSMAAGAIVTLGPTILAVVKGIALLGLAIWALRKPISEVLGWMGSKLGELGRILYQTVAPGFREVTMGLDGAWDRLMERMKLAWAKTVLWMADTMASVLPIPKGMKRDIEFLRQGIGIKEKSLEIEYKRMLIRKALANIDKAMEQRRQAQAAAAASLGSSPKKAMGLMGRAEASPGVEAAAVGSAEAMTRIFAFRDTGPGRAEERTADEVLRIRQILEVMEAQGQPLANANLMGAF